MKFERNYSTLESKSYWDRLDKAVDEIRIGKIEKQKQASESHLNKLKSDILELVKNDCDFRIKIKEQFYKE